MSAIPEPPDGAIVAWGAQPSMVLSRVDAWAEGRAERWYAANERLGAYGAPLTWEQALARAQHDQLANPYLLVPQPLTAAVLGDLGHKFDQIGAYRICRWCGDGDWTTKPCERSTAEIAGGRLAPNYPPEGSSGRSVDLRAVSGAVPSDSHPGGAR